MRSCITGVEAAFSIVGFPVLSINQILFLHDAIQLHVTLVLLADICRVHRNVAVTRDSDADGSGGAAGEDRQEREDDHKNCVRWRHRTV